MSDSDVQCCDLKLSEGIIRKYFLNYDLVWLLINQEVPADIIRKYNTNLDSSCWRALEVHQTLPEDFIDDYFDKLNWRLISYHQVITPFIAKKYDDKIDWDNLSASELILDEVIDLFPHKIDWWSISRWARVSEYIFDKYVDELYLDLILENTVASNIVKDEAEAIISFNSKY